MELAGSRGREVLQAAAAGEATGCRRRWAKANSRIPLRSGGVATAPRTSPTGASGATGLTGRTPAPRIPQTGGGGPGGGSPPGEAARAGCASWRGGGQ
eukprot:5906463-Alexandrium_andersonii.AAC.1